MPDGRAVLDRLRQPAYTGENRCLPCTVLNVALAGVLGAVLATVAVELAAVAVGLSLLAIYLRGYLVPGTPELTKCYLPERVRAALGADHADDSRTWETLEKMERERENAVDPEAFLRETGAVEPCGEDLCLAGAFADEVAAHERHLSDEGVGRAEIATLLDADPGDVDRKDHDYPAVTVDRRVRKWPSEAALVADVAAHRALAGRTDEWGAVPLEQSLDVLESLRSFRETCPACGGEVAFGTEAVESCCGAYEVTAVDCRDCGARLAEHDPSVVGSGPTGRALLP